MQTLKSPQLKKSQLKQSLLKSSLLLAIAVPAAFADTGFGDTVPREVAEQLLGNPLNGEGKLYSDIVDDFPPFTVPPEFEVLASADQVFTQRVILKTTLDEEAANAALMAAFTAEAWLELPVYGRDQPQTGFISGEPTPRIVQLCKDGVGNLTLVTGTGAAPRYVHLTRNIRGMQINGMQPSCADQIAMSAQGGFGMRMTSGPQLIRYAPRLELPSSSSPGQQIRSFSEGGGSQNDWETRGALAIDWSVGEVFAHFATQIAAQGWSADAESTGASVATGSWAKVVDGMNLVGLLTIVEFADNNWDLKFRIINKGGAGVPAAGNPVAPQ